MMHGQKNIKLISVCQCLNAALIPFVLHHVCYCLMMVCKTNMQHARMNLIKVCCVGRQYTNYSHAPHNDVSVNDGPHIRQRSQDYNIIPLCYTVYSIQYSNMVYRFVAQEQQAIPYSLRVQQAILYYPGLSTLYDVRTTTKSPNDTFLRKYPRR